MTKYKILIIYIVIVGAVVALGLWLFNSSKEQEANLPGQKFEFQGQDHLTQGSFEHPAYNSNPPTSGWHWPQPAGWGAYANPMPDEQLIHNLEHGGIWISYRPDRVDEDTVKKLNDFASRYTLVVVAPREKNDSTISLAAWTRLQHLDQYDERTILQFIDAYYNKGPEKVL